MSVATPSPSPSPTLGPGHSSSPHHHAQHSTKPGSLVSAVKSLLSEQSSRLTLKHNTDIELLDDLRLYLKTRCSIERDYAQSLAKLTNNYSKRSSQLLSFAATEDESADTKTVYTSWKIYQEELEKHAKNRLTQFEQLGTICEALKTMRSHKSHVAKKSLDSHLKKMQEEVITSVMEIDKTRKLYFDEEHLAKQARDKEEKIKKRKTGIFSSFANLQNKKERTSAHREASDIQSTQARNEYLMALAAGNAHLEHYYSQDLPNLMYNIDDTVLDKCRGYIISLLQAEREIVDSWSDVVSYSTELMENSSADQTNTLFLRDPNSSPLNETLFYEFQPCENDTVDIISLDHNADIALRNEAQKWFSWFSKECRNLNRLSAQLVRVQALMSEGHKTVEVTGGGQMDIETRIDDIRQQLRKSEISKLKAKARLQIIRSSGAEVEDFENFEAQVAMEIKQQSLDVDLNLNSLSRTPSVRSSTGVEYRFGNKSDLNEQSANAAGQQQQPAQQRPESSSSAEQLDSPDREVLQLGGSMECASPAPTTAAYSTANTTSWNYDPAQVWESEPVATSTAAYNGYETGATPATDDYAINQTSMDMADQSVSIDQSTGQEGYYDEYAVTADGFTLVGKQCYVLYAYVAQNEGDLTVNEQEIVTVQNASDKDWVQCQNETGECGFVPASYLQEIPEPAAAKEPTNSSSMSQSDYQPEFGDTANAEMNAADESAFEQPLPPPPPPQEGFAESFDFQASSTTQSEPGYARAIYDYVATNDEEISFCSGEMIQIIDNSSDDGWWTGKNKDGQVGHFPSMLVCEEEEEEEEEDSEEETEDEEQDDEENEDVEMPNLPPSITLPPVVCPVDLTTTDPDQDDTPAALGAPPPPPPPFAPPPKPMQLIAPQTVVIIQPTPEIESRPALGSEEIEEPCPSKFGGDDNDNDETVIDDNLATNNNQTTSGTDADPSVKVSVAIAAHEVSETLTQHAMDDSMKELSRRTSAASSCDGTIGETKLKNVNEDLLPGDCEESKIKPEQNGKEHQVEEEANQHEEEANQHEEEANQHEEEEEEVEDYK